MDILDIITKKKNGKSLSYDELKFAFNGYLPVKDQEREKAVRDFEALSRRQDMTQIFIETPYRNSRLMECLLKILKDDTLLCIASHITNITDEKIITKSVKQWKLHKTEIPKVPTIFMFYCGSQRV